MFVSRSLQFSYNSITHTQKEPVKKIEKNNFIENTVEKSSFQVCHLKYNLPWGTCWTKKDTKKLLKILKPYLNKTKKVVSYKTVDRKQNFSLQLMQMS